MIEIRRERSGDQDAVRELNRASFQASALGHQGEAQLVDRVRAAHHETVLSLVAIDDDDDDRLVGHILFSPVEIQDQPTGPRGMGLAPMAVAPHVQGIGVGSKLVEAGLRRLKKDGVAFVIVLGHPTYYPRFGFRPASEWGAHCEFQEAPTDAFMLLMLEEIERTSLAALLRYVPEFGG